MMYGAALKKNNPWIFNGLCKPWISTHLPIHLFFGWCLQLLLASLQVAIGVAHDRKRRWVVQLFHLANIGGFLLLPLECWKCDPSHLSFTPTASPTTFGSQEEQHIPPIRNKEKVKTDSEWSESGRNIYVNINHLPKKKWIRSFWVGCLRISKKRECK